MTPFTPPPPLDEEAMDAARQRWATRAKPPGSLGRIEHLAVHLAGVAGTCPPPIPTRPEIALFAGDHGVVADGASAWPSAVTAAMVQTIAAGGAAINAFATSVGAGVTVVDVGVASDLGPVAGVRDERIRSGTGSIAAEPAMTRDEAESCLEVGQRIVTDLIGGGADCVIGGEMGIGNTTPSAAIIAACTGIAPADLVGPGAGTPAAGMDHKVGLVSAALDRAGTADDPIDLLAELGGLEIGALAGAYITAAHAGVPFVVDGVIALAALCLADELAPGTASRAIAGHRSVEPAATVALDHLGLQPLLDLQLRLGEGTGACLSVPLVVAAARAIADMADLPTG